MSLQEQIKYDRIIALKAKESQLCIFLGVVGAEFSRSDYYKTHKLSDSLPEEEEIKVLQKMLKNSKEMKNDFEIKTLESYLPKMLDQGDILVIITKIIVDNGITDVKEMGKVMGLLKQHPQSALIDNKFASAAIRLQLTK